MLKNDQKNRSEFKLSNGKGRIFSYHPYKSMQLMFIDVHSKGLPDFWELGYRKGDDGRYLRTLLCKRGSCDFTVNGVTSKLSAGQVMMDYGVGDSCDFTFDTEDFMGVEITMQVDTLIDESSIFKMLRLVIESMGLPEEEIYDSDGYIFSYSKTTDQAMVKLLNAAFEQKAGIVILAHTVEIGNSLGSDLKAKNDADKSTREKKQIRIAEDIYKCLTEDYATKYTAAVFANKYFVIYVSKNQLDINRLGVSVSKKIGNSVVRHRMKRLVKETFRLRKDMSDSGLDIVVIIRKGAEELDNKAAVEALQSLMRILIHKYFS